MSIWTDSDGNSLGEWEVMDRDECWAFIRANDLAVFASLTDPGGFYGPRQVYTAWGFQGDDAPQVDICDYKDDEGKTERQICRKFVPLGGEQDG